MEIWQGKFYKYKQVVIVHSEMDGYTLVLQFEKERLANSPSS